MNTPRQRLDSLIARADSRGVRLWAPDLARDALRRERPDPSRALHLYVCFADHFEPRWRKATLDQERHRVGRWVDEYPRLAKRHCDTFGRAPVRTLFFPVEEYRPEHLDALTTRVREGLFDVEVHLHHDRDDDYMRGYRDAQRHALHDANELRALLDATPEDEALLGRLQGVAARLARERGHDVGGFRLVTNTLAEAGQSVFHLHVHLLAGRRFAWPPG